MKSSTNTRIESLEPRIALSGIVAVDSSNHLIKFDSATPNLTTVIDITGLANASNETIMGIDFRPADGKLYALGIFNVSGGDDEGRIYRIDPDTGVATQVGSTPFFTAFLDNNDYSFDINPVADVIRVNSDRDNNLRVNPDTGALVATDTNLTPNPAVVGTAYSNNHFGAAATTLYAIDNATDTMVTIGGLNGSPSPNGGVVTTVGALGISFSSFKVGFDIEARTGAAYASITPTAGVASLYQINLTTGAATLIGAINGNPSLNSLTVELPNDLNIVNNTSATYPDVDGDKVTVSMKGAPAGAALSADNFVFSVGQSGSQLRTLDISDAHDGQEWAKVQITLNAVPVGGKGDSFTNVGFINAAGVDLGKVMVNGDLGRIDVGLTGNAIAGLASLNVQSFGLFNTTTQTSTIVGKLGGLTVKSDFGNGLMKITDTDGSITSVTIAGNLDGRGATGASGISTAQAIGKVVVGGSIFGGGISRAGNIESATTMGSVLVKGSIIGGTDDHTGNVFSTGNMGNVTVKGSIIGGTVVGSDIDSGIVYSFANIGAIVVGGSLVGGNGQFSGALYSTGDIKSVLVKGSVKGGTNSFSGLIESDGGNLGNVTVLGDLIGGTGNFSGSAMTSNGNIANVKIGGSLVGGQAVTGIISNNQLGAVKISGGMTGGRISAEGIFDPTTAVQAVAIKSISVKGTVQNALLLAGYNRSGPATNPDAGIGAVTVGGNFIASSVIAGVDDGADNLFGTADDTAITEAVADTIFSSIASVTIKGLAMGTAGGGDHFGIVAQQVGKVKIRTASFILAAGTDTVGIDLGATFDLTVKEV